MVELRLPAVRPQPLIAVADVKRSRSWYQRVLDAVSGHGGTEYGQVLVDGVMVLQLHQKDVADHHGALADPLHPLGNGVAIWFQVDNFDEAVLRVRQASAHIEIDVHVNPNARQREIWLRDPDGYRVVLSESANSLRHGADA